MPSESDNKPRQTPSIPDSSEKSASSLDTAKIVEDLARKELEEQQNRESQQIQASHQRERTAVTTAASARRAEALGDLAITTPTITPPSTPENSPSNAPATTPEAPTLAPSSTPSTPAPETPSATPTSTPSSTPAPTEEKGLMATLKDKLKEIFAPVTAFFKEISGKISEKVKAFFDKLFKPKSAPTTTPTSAPAAATTSSSPEKPAGADTTWGLKGQELFNNPEFKAKNDQIATKIGCSSEDLNAIYLIESGGNPQVPANKVGTAGLIQWIPSVARSMYNLEPDQIRQMSGLQQLDLVEKYFSRYFGKLHSFSDLYRTVFYPASIGKGPDFIFGSESKNPDRARLVATQNPGIAKACGRADGLIDNAGFERFCSSHRPRTSGFANV